MGEKLPDNIEQEIAEFTARRGQLEAKGQPALERLVEVAQGGSGQCAKVRRFLLGLFNGPAWPLDLTDLRGLDRGIQDDVLATLAMDMNGPRLEVHKRVEHGEALWQEMVEREGGELGVK